ncbi:MAG: hypothetical protein RIT27_1386 [Pseudomonadota bacterium]|jgi:ABC-2 type transport system ATP-binding protein
MINIKKLVKNFHRQNVLDGIDLSISKGERIALVGSNGAGKTTLIRCLLGEYQYSGEITIDHLFVKDHRQTLLAKIGFVPQLPPPLKMPVGQLLDFAANLCRSPRSKMEEMSIRLGLETQSIWHKPFVKLSGGQKQKLLIGIALGRNSEILILDEPAANLDPIARRVFFELLAERQNQAIMLMSSHRLDEIAALVNRVIELDRGKVILDDKVAENNLSKILTCKLVVNREENAFIKTLENWHFKAENNYSWFGEISSVDRLKFLGVLSRYAGILKSIHIEEKVDETVVV